jgi:chromosome segregation ATPase
MAMAVHQKDSANLQAYPKEETTVITPDGQEIIIPIKGVTSAQYGAALLDAVKPWEREAALDRIKDGLLTREGGGRAPLRADGKGVQWDSYDILFKEDELKDANGQYDQARMNEAMAVVKEWATKSELPGREGARMAVLQDWHFDGNTPHIRVDLHRIPYPTPNTCLPMTRGNPASDANKDLEALYNKLNAAGFQAQAPASAQSLADAASIADGSTQPVAPRQQYSLIDRAPADENVLHAQLSAARTRQEMATKEIEQLEGVLAAKQQFDALKVEKERLETKVSDLEITLEKSVTENTGLKQELDLSMHEIDKLKEINAQNLQQIGFYRETISEKEAGLKTLGDEYDMLYDEHTELQDKHSKLETAYNDLVSDFSELKDKNTNLETRFEAEVGEKARIQTELEKVTSEKAALEEQFNAVVEKLETAQETVRTIENVVMRTAANAGYEYTTIEETVKNLGEALKDQRLEVVKLNEMVETKQAEILQKEIQIEGLTKDLGTANANVAEMTKLTTRQSEQLEKQSATIESMMEKFNGMMGKTQELQKTNENLLNQMSSLMETNKYLTGRLAEIGEIGELDYAIKQDQKQASVPPVADPAKPAEFDEGATITKPGGMTEEKFEESLNRMDKKLNVNPPESDTPKQK